VQSLVFFFSTSTSASSAAAASAALLTSVSLVDSNGAVVAGPVDATAVTTPINDGTNYYTQKVTFTDTITFPVGVKTYTLKGKVASGIANSTTYIAYTNPGGTSTSGHTAWTNITGQVTGNTISLTNLAFTMNTMTVKSSALTVSVSTNPPAQTIVPGGTVTFANYQLDATQSGEDVRFSSFPTTLTVGTAGEENKLSACQLYDGSTALNTGSNAKNPATTVAAVTFTFDSSLTIPKGTVKTLTLKCNVSSGTTAGAAHTFKWGITDTQITNTSTGLSSIVTGVTSAAAVTVTNSVSGSADQLGQVFTVGSGSLAITKGASSPSYAIATAGSTGVVIGSMNFKSTNQDVNLSKLGLQLTNTASSSSSDLVQATIWDGATQVGTVSFTGTNTTATSTALNNGAGVTLPKDMDKVLTIKADLASIVSGQLGNTNATPGHLISVDFLGAESTGSQSGTTIWGTGSTAFDGVRLMKSFPTVAIGSLPAGAVSDGRLIRFTVTADASGPINLAKFVVQVGTSSATVASVNAFGYTDSAYSQPIGGVNTSGQFMTANQTAGGSSATAAMKVVLAPQTSAGASTTIQVPAGSTRYFEVRGTVTAASGATNYSVVTTLLGDSAYPLAPPLLVSCSNDAAAAICGTGTSGVASTAAQAFLASSTPFTATSAAIPATSLTYNFVWSPNSTSSSAALTDTDWTTGYAVPGLPASGLIQSRTN
jgi:hypothetical protein